MFFQSLPGVSQLSYVQFQQPQPHRLGVLGLGMHTISFTIGLNRILYLIRFHTAFRTVSSAYCIAKIVDTDALHTTPTGNCGDLEKKASKSLNSTTNRTPGTDAYWQ